MDSGVFRESRRCRFHQVATGNKRNNNEGLWSGAERCCSIAEFVVKLLSVPTDVSSEPERKVHVVIVHSL